MGFKCGIVGLPNVGKSTLFNALTEAGIAVENYPFCTIDPNIGVVAVPDQRLYQIADIVQPKQVLPAHMEFVDIAGLIAGASQGEGLGNKFLAHIRETQAIAHVVRCFEDENVVHVEGRIDPIADIETINTELALADLATVGRALDAVKRRVKTGDKESKAASVLLEKIQAWLDEGHAVRAFDTDDFARGVLADLHLLTAKPVLYVANVDESPLAENQAFAKVDELARREGASCLAVCGAIEADLAGLDTSEKLELLADLDMHEPGLNRLVRSGFELLCLQTFFTAGPKEVRAWTTVRGATAPQAAGVIHTDFERGFIRAEVIGFTDFIQGAGEAGAKEAGKWRLEGKDYFVQDGDVIHFRFNV